MDKKTPADKIPVTILTGFLGSGKTTLLNRILTAPHGLRVAVIVNEFGEVGIDHDLLLSSDQQVVEMNNGCICCTVRADLVDNLLQLLAHGVKFDRVIIETTGLAEPGPVAQSLYADEDIRRRFTLDGVVTVVDAKHCGAHIADSAEIREQIAFADLILLNKIDLATAEELDALERGIGRLNRIATVYRTRNCDINLDAIFAIGAADLTHRMGHGADDHHHHAEHNHHHLADIETVCILDPGALDGLKLSIWFRSLIADLGPNLLRMKGILNLKGDPDQFLFQGVQMEFEGKPGRAWEANEERLNRLVFIGKTLDQTMILHGFQQCLFTGTHDRSATPDPFGRSNLEISPHALDQIRYWMRQNFGFSNDIAIVIKEVPCIKPRCPPIETAIMAALKNEPPRLFKIQRPINEVTFDHVYDLVENPMPCC